MARVTDKKLRELFPHFVKDLGGWVARSPIDVGGYQLSINPSGYYVIEQVINEGGGVSEPFGSTGRTADEMYTIVNAGSYIAKAAAAIKRAALTGDPRTAVRRAYSLPDPEDNPSPPLA